MSSISNNNGETFSQRGGSTRVFGSFAELAAGRGLRSRSDSDLQRESVLVVPGRYHASEFVTFCERLGVSGELTQFVATSRPRLTKRTLADVRDHADLVYLAGRQDPNAPLTGFEDELKDLVKELNPGCQIFFNSQHEVIIPNVYSNAITPIKPPYGYKGGAARRALRTALLLNTPGVERDLDLVRYGYATRANDDRMSRCYMPEDYKYNRSHGVENIRIMKRHLLSRDLTVNEVTFIGGVVTTTVQCLYDTIAGVIRPSLNYFQRGRNGLPDNTAMKALRLFAERVVEGRDVDLHHFVRAETGPVGDFWVALGLRRALEHSRSTGRLFLVAGALTEALPVRYATGEIEDACVELKGRLRLKKGFFKEVLHSRNSLT